MFYHYYLLLHFNDSIKVGILIDKFHQLFYGFSDFFVVDTNTETHLPAKDELKFWLKDYDGIYNKEIPIIYW